MADFKVLLVFGLLILTNLIASGLLFWNMYDEYDNSVGLGAQSALFWVDLSFAVVHLAIAVVGVLLYMMWGRKMMSM